MKDRIMILILLFVIGICFSYKIIEGIDDTAEEAEENSAETVDTAMSSRGNIVDTQISEDGSSKTTNDKITLEQFFNKLNDDGQCDNLRSIIKTTKEEFTKDENNRTMTSDYLSQKLPFADWASLYTFVLMGNVGTSSIMEYDTNCNTKDMLEEIENEGKSYFDTGSIF